MGDVEDRIFDLILKHLPPPPASIRVVCDEPAEAFSARLESVGYQAVRYSPSNVAADLAVKQGDGGLGRPIGEVVDHGSAGILPTACDAVFLYGDSDQLAPWIRALKGRRSPLRERSAVLIYHRMERNPSAEEDSGSPDQDDLLLALYELGCAVQFNERVGDHDNVRIGHKKPNGRAHRLVVGRRDGVLVRGYRDGDEADILTMFREVFRVDRTLAHWHWKFRDNPYGATRIAEAFSADGTLAGHYSGYPVPFWSSLKGQKEFFSYQIGDIMTRPGFRQVGLANTSVLGRITDYFHRRFCHGQVPFMYGFITGNHKRFGERFLRYRYLHDIPYHVLEPAELGVGLKGRAASFLTGLSVKPVRQMTSEFDAFFHEASQEYGLLVKRDAQYLQWRYLDCPDRLHTLFAVRRFGKLAGWGVFSRRGNVLIWGDALFRKTTDVGTLRQMLDHVVREYFPDVTRMEAWFSPEPHWWTRLLHDVGFKVTAEPNKLVAGVTTFGRSFPLEWIQHHLYYAMGDSDLF